MKLYEFVNSCLIKSNMGANATEHPFSSALPEMIEIIDCLNDLLKSFPTKEKLSQCRTECSFHVWRPWIANSEIAAGESRVARNSQGKQIRYKCVKPGLSETQPEGVGIFTMNENPNWIGGTNCNMNQQYKSDESLWQPSQNGVCGAVPPTGTADFTDDAGFVWRYVRPVLYWRNMGPATDYPFDEIAPNYANMETGTLFEMTQGLKLVEIPPEIWQARTARQISMYSQYYMVQGGAIKLFPEFNPGNEISFLYYVNDLVVDADDGHFKTKFEKDDDELRLIPDQLFEWGSVRAWLAQKGLDYSDADANLKDLLPIYRAQEQNTDHIDLTGRTGGRMSLLPDGNWQITTD
jgi:hypothetical protein